MTDKRFKYAGVSLFCGRTKIRWANDPARIKLLNKQGHTNLDLVELPYAMTKAEAVKHLHTIKYRDKDAEFQKALHYTARKNRVFL